MISPALFLPLIFLLQQQEPVPLLHPVAQMPNFSITSVRPARPDPEQGSHSTGNPETYSAQQVTVKEVIAYAFGVGYDGELVAGPSWVSNSRFDIQGKMDAEDAVAFGALGRDDREQKMRLMVQSLLAERFHLTYHFETRELPLYRLQIAKNGFSCVADPESPSAIADPSKPRFRWSSAPAPPPPPPG